MTKETLSETFIMTIVQLAAIPLLVTLKGLMLIFDFFTIYHPDVFRTKNSPGRHAIKIKQIQQEVICWNENRGKSRMCTARPAWKTLSLKNLDKRNMTQISVDILNQIVEIDEVNEVITVEPGMRMGALTYHLLKLGWTIPVIPEFESLTVGGCVCGTGIETTSHKYGLFASSCISYEVLLADGRIIVNCSPTENSDLFYAMPWSHGTLGFLTAVRIPIQRAPKYIKQEYCPVYSVKEAEKLLQRKGFEFIEGLAFGPNRFVVMFGTKMDNAEPDKINSLNAWYKPWFFKHVESFLDKPGKEFVEYIPARHYYHRHQRCYFWELAVPIPYGNSPLFRYLFGWTFPLNFEAAKLIVPRKVMRTLFELNHVLQDFLVPISALEETLDFCHDLVEVYPIWLCPCKFFNNLGMAHARGNRDEMYIDVGIYGKTPKVREYDEEKVTKKLEEFVIGRKGYQFLYADSFLSRTQFGQMFDLHLYDKVRDDLICSDAFPHVYDKVSRSTRN